MLIRVHLMALTPQNYNQGFLVDEELMAGVTENPDQAGVFSAYVLRHTTGEYLGHQTGLATLKKRSA